MNIELIDRWFIRQPRLRAFVTRLIYGEREQAVELGGRSLRIHTTRENGYLRAWRASASLSLFRDEFPVLLTLANFVAGGRTFVDVGANVGLYSVLLSKLRAVHPDFEVVAFEVDPDTFRRLQANAVTHGFTAHNVGIGEIEGTVEFVTGAVSHVTTLASNPNDYSIPGRRFTANVQALSHFDFGDRDLVVKIDVEGQEYAVLSGAAPLFDRRRVACVYVDGYSDARCWDFLESRGFELLDGRSLERATPRTFSLLALRPDLSPATPR